MPSLDIAWTVAMRLRTASKGTSATRGSARSRSTFHRPKRAAATTNAASVGSPTACVGSLGASWGNRYVPASMNPRWVSTCAAAGTEDSRAAKTIVRKLGVPSDRIADDLAATVGNPGSAQAGVLLSAALETAAPGQVIALLSLADGADALLFRTTEAVGSHDTARPVGDQAAGGGPVAYGKFLAWRGMLTPEPPRRPEPARPSASAASRNEDWKYGFVGSRDRSSGAIHLPPSRVSMTGDGVDDMEPVPRADTIGTIVTFTIDKLVYSPSPPVVFAVVDFDGGGRSPIELTDVDPADVAIGGRVEMTFRKLFTSDGIHNYFWKARPVRTGAPAPTASSEES